MSDHDYSLIRQEIGENWLTWCALQHFLPAPFLKELFAVIVDRVSESGLQFSDLFDAGSITGPPGLESWALRTRPASDPLGIYLQHRLQNLLWRNDSPTYPPEKDHLSPDRIGGPRDLEAAVLLGTLDFTTILAGALRDFRADIEPSLAMLAALVNEGAVRLKQGRVTGFARDARAKASECSGPILTVMLKHLGDLCADSDAWEEARAFYLLAQEILTTVDRFRWDGFAVGMRDILVQSLAAATRTIEGPVQAFEQLRNALEHATLDAHAVLVLNAPFDELVAKAKGGVYDADHRRGTLLEPTYYEESHNLDAVTLSANSGDFRGAQVRCWAVLRRQIALGLASQTRTTKCIFGRTILSALQSGERSHEEPSAFMLAVCLLIESADSSIERINWSTRLVDTHVDAAVVAEVIAITERHSGDKFARTRAALEMMRRWLLCISNGRHLVAGQMIRFLAMCAHTETVDVMDTRNLGGRSLECLRDVGKLRPEFRASNGSEVESAVVSKLQPRGSWKATSNALELAIEWLDAFSSEEVGAVLVQTLNVLDALNPAAQNWMIVRPALRVLTAKPSVALCRSRQALGRRVLEAILRFGIEESQSGELIFNLRDFDPTLLRDSEIVAMLRPTIEGLRNRALNVNSSATPGDIQALLLSPTISRLDGVTDALEALKNVIRSAKNARPRLALPYAYAPLQMLVNRQEEFADELDRPRSEIDSWWEAVYAEVVILWGRIRERPALLAAFSLLPSDHVDPILVHNWAFVSMHFAESLHKGDDMLRVVKLAAEQEALRTPIQRALATGTALDTTIAIKPQEILAETADVYYDALGHRLLLLDSLGHEGATALCRVLLAQCMRFGPNGLDAAVLVRAIQLNISGEEMADLSSNYLKRVDECRDLRLSLLPLLEAMKVTRFGP
jgi:hypothetical protein